MKETRTGSAYMVPKLSVITVCYNAANEIKRTVESVLEQTFTDYEYIFADGASTDATLAEIERYRSAFESKGVQVYVKSEPDKGIYDAMNKGIAQARGQWIFMLNAGDCLYDAHVFDTVFSRPDLDGKIIYGDAIMKEDCKGKAYYKYKPAYPLPSISTHMPFCHQSVFVPRGRMRQYGFDSNLQIAADYKFFSQLYKAGAEFTHIPRAISIYDRSGISSVNAKKLEEEYSAIRKEFYPNAAQAQKLLSDELLARVKAFTKRLFPALVYSRARGWYTALPKTEEESFSE